MVRVRVSVGYDERLGKCMEQVTTESRVDASSGEEGARGGLCGLGEQGRCSPARLAGEEEMWVGGCDDWGAGAMRQHGKRRSRACAGKKTIYVTEQEMSYMINFRLLARDCRK